MIEYVCILIIAEIRPICMITKRMVGQPWFAQHNKFIIQFTCILANNMRLNIYPNFMLHLFYWICSHREKKMYSYLFLGDLGLLSMPHTLLSDLEKIYIYNILFPFSNKGPTWDMNMQFNRNLYIQLNLICKHALSITDVLY